MPPEKDEEEGASAPRAKGKSYGRQDSFAQWGSQEGKKKSPEHIRSPQGQPIKGTIVAIMMVVAFTYFLWLYSSPINYFFGTPLFTMPSPPVIVIDTIIFIPLIYYVIRLWLRTMMKRKSGPAAGIDTVEPGPAKPEPGDEYGPATQPYKFKPETKIPGPKSDIREPLLIDSGFFVKTPDLESGEPLFDLEALRVRAMTKSRVSSGGWIHRCTSTRSLGSLVSTDSVHGRPYRARIPHGEPTSIDISATVLAAVTRSGKFHPGKRIEILPSDIRETVYAGKTPLTIMLIIDVSLSMRGFMKTVRKIVGRIEDETRGTKDRVGIIAFKDSGAIEVQTPTTNWNKLYRGLSRLRISGLTPLAEGVMKALDSIRREKMRKQGIEPLLIIISDFAPNIPLAQSVGPGHASYTPVRDLVKAARLAKKNGVRVVTVNVNPENRHWMELFRLPYHDALEMATMFKMRKEKYDSVIETILSTSAFRRTFSSYLIAYVAGGRTYLASEVLRFTSVLPEFLSSTRGITRIDPRRLGAVEDYLANT